MSIRPATPDDAPHLARLINMAGEGLPAYLWLKECGDLDTVLAEGEARARRETGGFSYRNAWVFEKDGQVAGMVLGYQLKSRYDASDLDECPGIFRPLVELESLAPGSYYINAIAVYSMFQGKGIASELMQHAEQQARDCGAKTLSLLVASENPEAKKLYQKLNYHYVDSRPVVPFPGIMHGGDWELMVKQVASS